MAFTPKKVAYRGAINAVTLGTGDKAIVIGGQNVLPFYTFDAPIENAPKIGVEISDCAGEWTAPALKEFYAGCTTMVDYAKKAETMPGADFLCLHLLHDIRVPSVLEHVQCASLRDRSFGIPLQGLPGLRPHSGSDIPGPDSDCERGGRLLQRGAT